VGSWSYCGHGTVNDSITVAELYRFAESFRREAGQSVESRVQDIALLDIEKRREMTVGTQNN
jgi:hypothetical protein